jgi:hypothetical protein
MKTLTIIDLVETKQTVIKMIRNFKSSHKLSNNVPLKVYFRLNKRFVLDENELMTFKHQVLNMTHSEIIFI